MSINDQTIATLEQMKQHLLEIGVAIPGTIHALYSRCGSPSCPCAHDDNQRHGPYYRWHYRSHGRHVVKGISQEDLSLFKQWIENREKIGRIVEQILELGTSHALEKQGASETRTLNTRKPRSSTRGK